MVANVYYDPESEGVVYWIRPEAEAGLVYYSDDDSDSGDSTESGETLLSCEVPDYFHEVNGRLFVNNPNVPIWHPVDEPRRLKLQHKLLKLVYGANHFGPVGDILRPRGNYRPRALEIGTRDGSWVQEMAQEFPHVHFLSVDIAPIVDHIPRENITFEVYDLSSGILERDESFDFVRIAHATEIMKDVRSILQEARRVLKPGGLLLVVEPETALYESHDCDQQSLVSTPLTWRAIDTLHRVLSTQGVEVNACRLVEQWLSPESELWARDPSTFLPFEAINAGTQVVHAGGWDLDTRRQEIRLVLAQLGTICWRNLTAAIAMSGLCDDAVQELVDGAVKELRNPCTSYAIKFHHVFARKSHSARQQES